MLKRWKEPQETFLNLIAEEQEETPCYNNQQQSIQDAEFGKRLTSEQ